MSTKDLDLSLNNASSDSPISDMNIFQTPQAGSFLSLSEEDEQEIDAFVSQIDITDSVLVFNYGENCRAKIAALYSSVFNCFNKKDYSYIKDYITQIEKLLADFSIGKSVKKNSFLSKYQFLKTKSSVHKIANELDSQQLILMHDNDVLSRFDSNLNELYKTITKYIVAGEKRLEQVKTDILPMLKQNLDVSIASTEEYNRMVQYVNTFEQKLYSLSTSKEIALQLIAQINIILKNNTILIETIKETINSTIPAWENSFN